MVHVTVLGPVCHGFGMFFLCCRVVLGPELVVLGPGEQLTVLSLSAGRPKRPHARRSLCLRLGPDFCADIVTIETADHARLQLQLAYNWWVRLMLVGHGGG